MNRRAQYIDIHIRVTNPEKLSNFRMFMIMCFVLYGDHSFSFEMTSLPVSHFLKAAAGFEKGAQKPGKIQI